MAGTGFDMGRYPTQSMPAKPNKEVALWLRRRAWDAKRFGVSAAGIGQKLGLGSEPKIVSISIPKAGTHLIERVLCLHPGLSRVISRTVMGDRETQRRQLERLLKRQRPGQVICGHIHHTAEVLDLIRAHGAAVVFTVRDPRDIVVSSAHYMLDSTKHPWHSFALESPELRDRIRMFIDGQGNPGPPAIRERLEVYSGWLEDADCLVRFEEMIDPVSGREAVDSMFTDLGVSRTPDLIDSISAQVVSPVSVTFRSGGSGGWNREMDGELLERFHETAGDVMQLYGYS